MFQHITLYHQNEPNFSTTCNLHNSCGALCRTYSAYKAHDYRKSMSELQLKNKSNDNLNISRNDNEHQENINTSNVNSEAISDGDETFDSIYDNFHANLIDGDFETNTYNPASFFTSTNTNESVSELLLIMKQLYLLFILELREEYLLP
ncbi:unnamed protein product [Adineta ricciae]|uniref:Uncharacterized protein n=1 Tax=Adineta ricciae TaxID=249248 RepID=A0A815A9G8_ADIRI|nr:unnamed protein product [Adineta ricciae]CAF1509978.1 unnamed protein product [Adineta ricciae]